MPRERLEDFARLAAEHVRETMPGFCDVGELHRASSPTRHLERIQGLLDEARARGCDVRPLEEAGEVDPDTRQLPMSLVLDPPDDLGAHAGGDLRADPPGQGLRRRSTRRSTYVNAGERPLALYVFAKDEAVADDVLRRTTSGGACVNAAAVHGALPSLPFGGIGQSGSGRHHGIEGFREFSNLRGAFVRGEGDLIEAFAPPYGQAAQAVVDAAFAGPA